MHALRLIIGFLLAPLSGALSSSLLVGATLLSYEFFIVSFYAMAITSYIFAIFGGIPILILLHWRRFIERNHYMLAASVIGTVPFILMTAISANYGNLKVSLALPALGAFGGAVSGLVFWLITRPDRLGK